VHNSDVFIDQLKPKGTNWRKENDQKLIDSDIVIVILTNGALGSSEVEREVNIAKTNPNRIIVPCKDDLLKMDWHQMPYSLGDLDGMEFERKEELGRKLVGEIRGRLMPQTLETKDSTSKLKPVRISGLPNTSFELDYGLTNGDVLSATIIRDTCSLIITLATYGPAVLEVSLPRHMLDAKRGEEPDVFFVLVDTEESNFTETIDEDVRTLKISLPHQTDEVEIIGTEILGTSFIGSPKTENIIKILPNSSRPHGGQYLDKEILTINAGEKVRWVNDDYAAHTITSGTPDKGPDGIFDSSLFLSKNNFEVSFGSPGTFEYFCMVHPWKTGKIIVK
jgi:hypothetical protein